jgi:regulator of nucleoside diphosphate kinase
LAALLLTREGRACGDLDTLGKLDSLLEVYPCLDDESVPDTLVTMNSEVEIAACDTGRRRRVRLAYPFDLDLAPDSISILDPLGLALFGRRVGDVIQSSDGNDGAWRIARVTYQPERVGASHL